MGTRNMGGCQNIPRKRRQTKKYCLGLGHSSVVKLLFDEHALDSMPSANPLPCHPHPLLPSSSPALLSSPLLSNPLFSSSSAPHLFLSAEERWNLCFSPSMLYKCSTTELHPKLQTIQKYSEEAKLETKKQSIDSQEHGLQGEG